MASSSLASEVRERLTANRTYYARTDGSDSNDGLANTSAGAFLTIQAAVNAVARLDVAGYTVTIQIADGTYTAGVTLPNVTGFAVAGSLVIQGNNGTPANVVISTTSVTAFSALGISSVWDIKDLKIQTTTSGYGINVSYGATIRYGNVNFGACVGAQILAELGGRAIAIGNYTISGSSPVHAWAVQGALIDLNFVALTLSGTPAFSTNFARAETLALVQAAVFSFSGSATGVRYSASGNSVISTLGGGAGYLPGNSAGATATGGLYI